MHRRDFFKTSAILGTIASLECTLKANAFELTKSVNKSGKVCSICEMCSTRCPIEVKVKDGEGVFIQGNPLYKENLTSVCARGGAGITQLYDKQRIVKPLIRVGKRGENKWREASWDEALSLCAEKLNLIKEKYGAQSVIFTAKGGRDSKLISDFAAAFGSPNVFTHYSCCPITYQTVLKQTYGFVPVRDFKNAKYIVNFGHNLFEGIAISETKPLAKFAKDKKTKFLVLDPRFSVVAAKADEWLPIKPGTDLAFVMALIHIWLRDGKYDKEFVEKYTIGLDELKKSIKETTPQWQEEITGIPAQSVERIADEIYQASPEVIIDWGHKTTTTRAEFQRTRAIAIANALMGNFEKKGGIFTKKDAKTLNDICDQELFPTLANPSSAFKIPNTPRIDGAGEKGKNRFVLKNHGVLMDIAPAILEQKPYAIKGWVNTRFNHLANVAGTQKTIEALDNLDFIVSVDIYLNDFSNYADVVLPEATYLERDEWILDLSKYYPAYYVRNKAVEVIGDSKDGYEIFRDLAVKMGIGKDYCKDIKEYRIKQTKGDADLLLKLVKDGYVEFPTPELYFREAKSVKNFVEKFPTAKKCVDMEGLMSQKCVFKTPSKKIELFLKDVEEEFLGYGSLNTKNMDVFGNHEFCLCTGKTPVHTNGHTQANPMLNSLMSYSPIWIHTSVAKKKNIKTGDKVILENEFGIQQGEAFVTEGIRPDTLFVYHGFGHQTPDLKIINGIGVNQNVVLNTQSGDICGTMVTNVGITLRKA